MNFTDRMSAVLHGGAPDKVPCAPYNNLLPRGAFAREMLNRGMGLLVRCSTVWSECPNVSVETNTDGDLTTTTYHTPEGDVWTSERTHISRQLTDGRRVRLRGMIHEPADYDPVLFMIEDTVFHSDPEAYYNAERDYGDDGQVRDSALISPPFYSTARFYGTSTPEGMAKKKRWRSE